MHWDHTSDFLDNFSEEFIKDETNLTPAVIKRLPCCYKHISLAYLCQLKFFRLHWVMTFSGLTMTDSKGWRWGSEIQAFTNTFRDAFLQDHMWTWSWVTAFDFIFPVTSSKTAEVTGLMENSMILCHSNACAAWIDGIVNRCFCGGTKMWWEHAWCFLWAHGKLVGCKTSKWLTNAINMRYTERRQLGSVAMSLNYFPSKTIEVAFERSAIERDF